MAMKAKFSLPDLRAQFAEIENNIESAIINEVVGLGEELVNHARSVRTYMDQTGNLRSSIGYIVADRHGIVSDNFKATTPSGASGKAKAQTQAQNAVSGLNHGIKLVVVGGMEYAADVERRGYDVLASAEQKANIEVPKIIQRIKEDIASL